MADPYIGEIKLWPGNFAPRGWLMCDGQLLSISDYDALFNLIGTTYGGNGQTTFALPDLRGRVPVHVGGPHVLGQQAGAEQVTLKTQELPIHTHALIASQDPGSSANAPGNVLAQTTSPLYLQDATTLSLNPKVITPYGGSQPHDNRQPYLGLNFIIATDGIYPPPS